MRESGDRKAFATEAADGVAEAFGGLAEGAEWFGRRGPESDHWQKQADAFGRLRPAPGQPGAACRKRIAEAGAAVYGDRRDRAARRERDERVYGRGR